MLKKDLIIKNPLSQGDDGGEDLLVPGGFGAVLSRAGVGKTALVVQIALTSMLRNKNVLHISLNDPIDKVTLWYRDLFGKLAQRYHVEFVEQLWQDILRRRLIMTFRVMGFSVPKLEERLSDMVNQGIFSPAVIVIDGFDFAKAELQQLEDLKSLARSFGASAWFTVPTHRDELLSTDGLPLAFSAAAGLFDIAYELKAVGSDVHISILKRVSGVPSGRALRLDPETLLITEET
ncbi:MAG: AAA family ATPase [Deltaproteobacteria bacterium]|nr:AAA family ATPase [Deltaproteobacteria bacterium]